MITVLQEVAKKSFTRIPATSEVNDSRIFNAREIIFELIFMGVACWHFNDGVSGSVMKTFCGLNLVCGMRVMSIVMMVSNLLVHFYAVLLLVKRKSLKFLLYIGTLVSFLCTINSVAVLEAFYRYEWTFFTNSLGFNSSCLKVMLYFLMIVGAFIFRLMVTYKSFLAVRREGNQILPGMLKSTQRHFHLSEILWIPIATIKYRFPTSNDQYEKELKHYKKQYKNTIQQHWQQYWNHQKQAENIYIQDYNLHAKQKYFKDCIKHRNSIVNIAMHTQKHIQFLKQREIKQNHTNHIRDLKNLQIKHDRKMMLQAMEAESDNWITLHNYSEKIQANMLVPNVAMHHDDYFQRLQKIGLLVEQGNYVGAQKILEDSESKEYKNALLTPLYRNLKKSIRWMTYSNQYQLFREYSIAKAKLSEKHNFIKSEEYIEEFTQLKEEFVKKYEKLLKEESTPMGKITKMENTLQLLFDILLTWCQYIEIIYIPSHHIEILREFSIEGIMELRRQANQGPTEDDRIGKIEKTTSTTSDSDKTDFLYPNLQQVTNEWKDDHKISFSGKPVLNIFKKNQLESPLSFNYQQIQKYENFDQTFLHKKESKQTNQKEDVSNEEKISKSRNLNYQKVELFLNDLQQKINEDSNYQKQPTEFYLDKEKELLEEEIARQEAEETGQFDIYGEKINVKYTPIKEMLSPITRANLKIINEYINSDKFNIDTLIRKDALDYPKTAPSSPLKAMENNNHIFLNFFNMNDTEKPETRYTSSLILDSYKNELKKIEYSDLDAIHQNKKIQLLTLLKSLSKIKVVDSQVLMKIYNMYRFPQPTINSISDDTP